MTEHQKDNVDDKVEIDVTTTSSTASKKRSASPTQFIDESNADSHKRIKTDDQIDVNGIVETTETASA